jgi:chromosome segregation ATPase
VAAVATDEEILASDARFAPLTAAMQGLTLDDFRKKLTAQRKGLNKVRTDTPARLDECKKTVTDLSGIDFDALEHQRTEAQSKRTETQRELDQAEHDGGRTELQNQLTSVRNELGRLENENAAHRLAQQQAQGADEAAPIQQSLNSLHARETRRQRDLEYLRGRQTVLEGDVTACRARWDTINGEQFKGGACPTCGQPLPKDKLEASQATFEKDKERRKSEAVEAANRAKVTLAGIQADIAKLEQEAAEDLKQADSLTAQLKALEDTQRPEISDMDGYASRKAELEAQAAEAQKELDGLTASTTARQKVLRDALADVDRELERLSGELAKKTALEYANKRMEELRAQAAAASDELNQLDGMLFLCDEFVRYKVKFIEESINRRFSLVRFRLFKEQINGGLEDCCDVTVNGIPYATGLNSGAKVNAGIDIINTLSRHYGTQVPLFVDNAESVTQLAQADTQVIRLVVSETDKELRCELQ